MIRVFGCSRGDKKDGNKKEPEKPACLKAEVCSCLR